MIIKKNRNYTYQNLMLFDCIQKCLSERIYWQTLFGFGNAHFFLFEFSGFIYKKRTSLMKKFVKSNTYIKFTTKMF